MTATTFQPPRSHIALEWLIRGTNALFAVMATAFLCLIGVSFFLLLITKTISIFLPPGQATSHHYDTVLQAIPLILALGMAIPFVRYSRMGRDMWQSVNKDNTGFFVLLFAYLIAHVFYYAMPFNLPKTLNDHLWIIFQSREGDHGAYRFLWSMIVFFLFRHLIKSYLMRAFKLDSPARKPPSDDPTIPEFPQKSPLVPL